MGIAQRSTAALVIVGTVVAGVALTSVPAQAAPAKEVPVNAKTVTLTPAQVKSVFGVAQHRTEVINHSARGVKFYTANYKLPSTGNLALASTVALRAKSHSQLRKGVNAPLEGQIVVAKKYNKKTKSGLLTRVLSSQETHQDAEGHDVTVNLYAAVTYRYTNRTAVASVAVTYVPETSTNYQPAVHKANQSSKVLAKRFHVTG